MRMWAISLFFGFLCLLYGAQGLDCRDKNSMQQEQVKCFAAYNITLEINGEDLQNALQNDPEAVCRQQEEYKSAMRCAFDVAKTCLGLLSVRTDILPDADRMADGISYMCRHVTEVDSGCMKTAQPVIAQCATSRVLAGLSSMTDIKAITCGAFQFTYDCMKQHLAHCSGRTLEVNLEMTNQYLRPPACSPFDEGQGDSAGQQQPTTTMAPMTTAQLVTTVRPLPSVSCYDVSSIQRSQLKCFQREGLDVQLPDLTGSSSQAKQSLLDTILANDIGIESLCRQKTQYKAAFGCAMDVGRRCMPAGYEDYIPSASSMRDIVDILCDNSEDVDFQCALSKASELFDCGRNKALANGAGSGSEKDLLCNAFRWNVDCYKQVMPACGCRTAEVYVDMNKMINPPACAPITTPTPTCSTEQSETGFSNIFGAINVPDFEKCGFQRTALQCFMNERLGIMELFNPGEQANTSPAQQFFNKDFVGKLCAQKEGLKRAFSCAYSAVKQCMRDTEWLSYLPDVSKYLTAIDDVCKTNDDINYRCLIGVMEKFTECGSEKAANMSFNGLESLKDNICKIARYSAECLAEVMPECGCPTTRLVVKSVKNFNPPVCSAIETATPRCNPSTGAFESENGGGRQTFGVASLIMMLLAWLMSHVVV